MYPVRCFASLSIPLLSVRVRVSGLAQATINDAGAEQAPLLPEDAGVDEDTGMLAGAELAGAELAEAELALEELAGAELVGAELAGAEDLGVETTEEAGADVTLLDAEVVA